MVKLYVNRRYLIITVVLLIMGKNLYGMIKFPIENYVRHKINNR